jgi:hypothetical protein
MGLGSNFRHDDRNNRIDRWRRSLGWGLCFWNGDSYRSHVRYANYSNSERRNEHRCFRNLNHRNGYSDEYGDSECLRFAGFDTNF